jgi:hypothetical protein
MRFTTSSLIAGQTYFLRAFWLACKNVFFTFFAKTYFLRVFKYDLSQWPETLYDTYISLYNKAYYSLQLV